MTPTPETLRHTPTPSLSAREKIARLIDPAAFSGLERERAWAAKWKKPDHFWLPWQSCCENALTQADAILALVPNKSEIERLTARIAELEATIKKCALTGAICCDIHHQPALGSKVQKAIQSLIDAALSAADGG